MLSIQLLLFADLCCQILEEIRANGINIYTLPDCDDDEDEEFKQQCDALKVSTVKKSH